MPVNTTPKTVADLIGNVGGYSDAIRADNAAVAAASDSLKADTSGLDETNKALGQAVATLGGVYVLNPDETVTGYEPDNNGGYKPTTLKPASVAIPGA